MTKYSVVYNIDEYPAKVKSIKDTIVVRRADKADLLSFGGNSHQFMCLAWCADLNGKIIGVGGFYRLNARWVGFTEMNDEAAEYKVGFYKAARMIMDHMRARGYERFYAILDESFPNAGRWVEQLGFRRRGPRLWVWRAS